MAELNGEPPVSDTGQKYLHYAYECVENICLYQ
jgi:hypothetical protein